jgi:N-acetylglucosaminyl-diphospho-decaprenol L-rhamnosyltransferase
MDDITNKTFSHEQGDAGLWVSIVILNYNGKTWLKRCLESLYKQTIFKNLEIIVADNASTDGSDQLAASLIAPWPERAKFVQNGSNLGFCEGNNRGATFAKGDYLFFLNNDTWLEKDCMEQLLAGMAKLKADCGTPLICNYDDNSFQSLGALGFDLFGYMSTVPSKVSVGIIFAAPGCSLLVKTEVFWRLGGFDSELFMYGDEVDLAWRLALAGYKTVSIPQARLHHRSSAGFNSEGNGQLAEYRTNEMVRFLSNRNSLVVLLKNSQHILLLIAAFQALMLLLEAAVLLALVRKWSMVKYAYLGAFADCWRLRHHVYKERHRIRKLRRHSDFWMLRFLRPRFSRHSYEIKRLMKHGPPKVDPRKF